MMVVRLECREEATHGAGGARQICLRRATMAAGNVTLGNRRSRNIYAAGDRVPLKSFRMVRKEVRTATRKRDIQLFVTALYTSRRDVLMEAARLQPNLSDALVQSSSACRPCPSRSSRRGRTTTLYHSPSIVPAHAQTSALSILQDREPHYLSSSVRPVSCISTYITPVSTSDVVYGHTVSCACRGFPHIRQRLTNSFVHSASLRSNN